MKPRKRKGKELKIITDRVVKFWKEDCTQFYILSLLAKKYPGIPATSAKIERLLSKTSFILRKHRRSMSERVAENFYF